VSLAPGISLQLSPWPSQRSQTYEYVIGCSPPHWPRLASSVLPTRTVPEMDGSVVLKGRAELTTPVGLEVAVSWPSALRATTCERTRKPASPWRSVYVLSAAFDTREQSDASGAPPPLGHRYHRNSYVIGAVPVHVPRVVRST
jgi:hypothetical protein